MINTASIHRLIALVLALPVVLAACINNENGRQEKPVVRAGDYYLYKSDLQKVLPPDYTREDSIEKVQSYIDHWLKNHLMLINAENNLEKEEKDVEKLLKNYRMKLLIHRYKQKITQNKLDTSVTEAQMREYYKKNQEEFLLNSPYMKGVAVKLPQASPQLQKFKSALRRYNEEDSTFIEKYAYKHIQNYNDYQTGWFDFDELKFRIPIKVSKTDNFLKSRNYYETSDSLFHYFVKIRDYKLQGDLAPFTIRKKDIKNIILSERKIHLMRKLERQLYREGMNSKKVEFFVEH